MMETKLAVADLPVFDRNFWDGTFRFTRIGSGSLGGKAGDLVFIKDLLARRLTRQFPGVAVDVPTMAVVATDCFQQFIAAQPPHDVAFRRDVGRPHRPCLSAGRPPGRNCWAISAP